MNKKLIAGPAVSIVFLLATAVPAFADGALFPDSVYRDLYESAQKAVILYGNSSEHVILSTSFEGDAENFAWVVPVPNKPEIPVADRELFWELADLTATGYATGGGYGFMCLGGTAPGGQEGVDVIEEKVVGPYATAILSATNATALTHWLNANGYTFPEEGEEMVSEYIHKEWYFVATRINTVNEETGCALAEGAIEPIMLNFASDEIVYPLRITSLSAASPEVLLYVVADHVMVPEQYPLNIGYGNWQENAFTLEFGDRLSVGGLPDYFEILPQLISKHLSTDEFCLTKLRGSITADHMADIRLLRYAEGDSLGSLAKTRDKGGDVVVLAMIAEPALGIYLWRRRLSVTISRESR